MKSPNAFVHRNRSALQISCVVPVMNGAGTVGLFIRALHGQLVRLSTNLDIIIVNDGSSDDSREEILRVGVDIPLRYIELSRQFGSPCAIQAGLDVVQGDCAVVIHPSFEHPIGAISEMVRRWQVGADLVYSVPKQRRVRFSKSRIGMLIPAWHGALRQTPKPMEYVLDFCLLDRRMVDALNSMPESDRCLRELCAWAGYKSEPLPVEINNQKSRCHQQGWIRRATRALTDVTASSVLPLRLMTAGGALLAVVALLFACAMMLENLTVGQPIPGFTTLATAICFYAGVQLLAIGIVGEYVGRIFIEVKRRPYYFVAKDLESSSIDDNTKVESPPVALGA